MVQPLPLLTIAGSDSGGAAGLQADLKTWTALGAYGMSALTVVTAQNSERVERAHFLPPDLVAAQIDAVLSDYGAAAIKTGFLGRVELIEVVAERLAFWCGGDTGRGGSHRRGGSQTRPYYDDDAIRPFILIDPVLVNHRGEPMFPPEVAVAYRQLLFPLADLVTPNRHEAALLAGRPLPDGGDGEGLARFLASHGAERVLLKGLRRGEEIVDVLWDGRDVALLGHAAIDTANLHGSGDTLSAATCAFSAKGASLLDAVKQAQDYTHAAIGRGAGWRLGAGHGPLGHWAE